MYIDEEEYLAHYGTPRHSGRYPWGSSGWGEGENEDLPNHMNFTDRVDQMRRKGMTPSEIAKANGLESTTQLRAKISIANAEIRQAKISQIERLAEKGMSNVAIGKQMGIPESSVRSLRAPGAKEKASAIKSTADMLEKEVKADEWIDVGKGVENYLNVSKERLNTSLAMLKERGYEVHTFKSPQLGTNFDTDYKVLAMPGTTQKDAWMNRYNLKLIRKFSENGGKTYEGDLPPLSIDPARVAVRHGPEGGSKADGVIYVRPGVKDISLGEARYAQVRIKVGDDHFLKGMAMYKDDLPKGIDLVFNTNKSDTGNKLDAMKSLKEEDPFVAIRRQIYDRDESGERHLTSVMNIVNEEGNWKTWSNSLASQMLSKQPTKLAEDQLKMMYDSKKADYDAIKKLTNSTVRKKFLETFADSTDSDAVDLDAYMLPRQAWHAILPIESLPERSVYAPNFRHGETVALIRYPHGGTFEIPILKVNNRHKESLKLLGTEPPDAIGINPKVAERLSGADFDGDTVLVIPNDSGKISSTPALKGLEGFEPRVVYRHFEGMPRISKGRMQDEMGSISNLITDMSVKGAPAEDLVRAVRHSMVIIDSEKHYLNYKQSAIDNNIPQLKKLYQQKVNPETGKVTYGGASTLLSLATAKKYVEMRKERTVGKGGPVDLATGRRAYEPSGKTRVDRETGERVPRLERIKRLSDEPDAFKLSSGMRIETIYAHHSNKMKALANKARLESVNTKPMEYSKSAAKVYKEQVDSLTAKLKLAQRNAPLERQAQLLGDSIAQAKRRAQPTMEKSTYQKLRFKALAEARVRTGSGKHLIQIEPDEWNAIQAGAISNNRLTEIMRHVDLDVLRQLATPKPKYLMTPTKTARAASMLAQGYTRSEVAEALGVSVTTLDRSL